MADLLISVLLSGMAVTWLIEFVDLFSYRIMEKTTLNKALSLPLNFLGVLCLTDINYSFFVLVPAATFVSLVIGIWLNRPTIIKSQRLPRLL